MNDIDEHLGALKVLGDPNYSTLSEALTTIGTDEVTLVIPPGEFILGANTEIPAIVHLHILRGGYFTLGDYDLTINGGIEAGLYQISPVPAQGL